MVSSNESRPEGSRRRHSRRAGMPSLRQTSSTRYPGLDVLVGVASSVERPMAQVALYWVPNRPGVGTVLVEATKLSQLQANLAVLDFMLPPALAAELDAASKPTATFPYSFFGPESRGMITGAFRSATSLLATALIGRWAAQEVAFRGRTEKLDRPYQLDLRNFYLRPDSRLMGSMASRIPRQAVPPVATQSWQTKAIDIA